MKDIFDKIKNNRGPLGQHAKQSHGYFTFPKLPIKNVSINPTNGIVKLEKNIG